MIKKRNAMPLIVGLSFLGILFIAKFSLIHSATRLPFTPKSEYFDSVMDDTDIISYDESGYRKWHISAKRFEYSHSHRESQMTKPTLSLFDPTGTQMIWHLSSRSGKVQHQNKVRLISTIDLYDDVELAKYEANKLTSTLQSSHAHYDIAKAHIENNVPVTINNGVSKITGIGLSANLNTDEFKLLRNVKGYYHVSNF